MTRTVLAATLAMASLGCVAQTIHLVHVPYKGTGQAMSDLLGGQVVSMFDQSVSSLPHKVKVE